jgi:enhancing lycopene biosynthesis protein 2
MSTKRIAVVLSGCGVYDGAEIQEAVLTMLAINRQGADYQCFAPDIEQAHVINHLTGKEMHETRKVMPEAARIARGNMKPLDQFSANDFDALIFPGGFGVGKNLCSFAFEGIHCTVNPDAEKAVRSMFQASKPIGALCLAPVLIAKILGRGTLTIGRDPETAQAIEKLGGKHSVTAQGQIIVDEKNKVVTAPCYMLDATIGQIADETDKVVRAILKMT